MIDFSEVVSGAIKLADLQDQFTREDLIRETNEMIDTQLGLIEGAIDAYVTFEPEDPEAHDPYAATEEEVNMGWTLGHCDRPHHGVWRRGGGAGCNAGARPENNLAQSLRNALDDHADH